MKGAKLKIAGLVVVGFVIIQMMMLILVPVAALGAAVLGNPFLNFAAGISCHIKRTAICDIRDAYNDNVSEADRDRLKKNIEPDMRAALDCSTASRADRTKGNCITGLLTTPEDEDTGPVPATAQWLVPIWQKAADKYKVPWELVAAVNGARSYFGQDNCDTPDDRIGFMSLPTNVWFEYRTDAGFAKTKRDGACATSREPAKFSRTAKENSATANAYDAVDAIYTTARQLSKQGAKGKDDWDDYTGSPANQCTVPDADGQIYSYQPQTSGEAGDGAMLGYNGQLDIPRDVVVEAAKYRSNTGKWKPHRDDAPGSDARMPKEVVRKFLRVAWTAFGARGSRLQSNVDKNMKQVERESGFRPHILQGHIGDVNDNNPAGGLFQFIPGTFKTWRVAGFNDRFNPLDNILAAVNAQVNSNMSYILDGRSGWGPGAGTNPYAKGGKATSAGGSSSGSSDSGNSLIGTQTVGASVYSDPKGYKGDNLADHPYNFAELSRNPDRKDFSALGKLPYKARVEVTGPNGKTLTLRKYDIGAGGGPVRGYMRRIDIWVGAAKKLGLGSDGLDLVKIRIVGNAGSVPVDSDNAQKPHSYDGKKQTDDVSKAVRYDGGIGMSPCYVAIVHDWYKAIKDNPPEGGGGEGYEGIVNWANYIEKQRYPYCYGGGHGFTPAKPSSGRYCWLASGVKGSGSAGPGLDCSSSVSMLLQKAGFKVPTMVSGAYMNWGLPGPGKKVTIWANAGHIMMEIGGRFWETDGTNYRHGPGWSPKQSTAGYTARHPRGL